MAAAMLWGTAGAAGTLGMAGAGTEVSTVSLAAARLVIGGLVLALAAAPSVGRLVASSGRAQAGWLVLAAIAVAAYQLAFFAAVSRTGVAIGTVVAIGSGPVFTGLLAWLFDGVRPTARWSAATAAAVAGSAVLIAGGGGQAGRQVVPGILFALAGGLLYAFYAVVAARVIGAGAPSGAVMGVLFGGGGLIMVPVLLWSDTGWLHTSAGLGTAVYLGCATTALACFLYGRGLRATPVATAATLTLAEPAVASLLGVIVLGERLGLVSIGGLVLLGVSLVVVALPARAAGPRPAVRAESTV
ncbi:hypothetical protein Misp01_39440 [Microtetraspora sp. NBRC 13810]|nr:hypothetical protein Misp01_39440 [Microtetraspora sp. NBRC 13810]